MPLSRTTKNSSLKSQITILKKKNEELQRENMLINYKQMNLIRDYNSLRVEHKA
ncbi:14791_t:CDS:1, partial [Gigaspora margarita]